MPHLTMKFPNPNGGILTVKADQMEARECYAKSLLIKPYILTSTKLAKVVDVNNVEGALPSWANFDPRRDEEDRRPTPIEELH